MMKKVLMSVAMVAAMAASAQAIRYEAAEMSLEERPIVATGVELRGEFDGSAVTVWNTRLTEDGWTRLQSGGKSVDVLVLNTPTVEGGRLAANTTWGPDRIHVVRDDVVVPSGVTLTLAAGAVVKFLPGSRLLVGGSLTAQGALLADIADDTVGGDTNYDEDETAPSGIEWWLDDSAVAGLVAVSFLDGAAKAAPTRSYSSGVALGELPELAKDGAKFLGWYTAPDGAGSKVTASTSASSSMKTLYAAWQALSVAISPASATLGAGAGNSSFSVTANGAWTVSTTASWITLNTTAGENDGTVSFSVAANATTAARSGTIRVAIGETIFRDFTVNQGAMAPVATPVITPADGTTFSGSTRRVAISCATADATIRYTLDGSEPDETSILYKNKSFNVFDTTVVKAKAFKDGMLPSATASSRMIRLQTLPEAIDQPLWTVTTGGDVDWTVDTETSHDGKSSAVCAGVEPEESSWMETTVEGAGTLSFRWRVCCEDDPDNDSWDFLMLEVDNLDIAHLDGDSGWQQYTVKVKGEGAHTVRWTFSRDDMDDFIEYDNLAWVDQVTWTPVVGEAEVPKAWLDSLGVVGTDGSTEAAAKSDTDGDGFTAAEEYVMGTDPNDPESRLTASVEFVDGKPVITYTPNLLDDRKYIKWGKKDLADPTEEWTPVPEGQEDNYNFFKVSVEMP